MPTYRLFKMDQFGKFASSEALDAFDDDEALKAVRDAGHSCDCEVWLLRRLVGRILTSSPA
jgi:hypothetical protein